MPASAWGTTPPEKQQWYTKHNCDTAVGGKGLPRCNRSGHDSGDGDAESTREAAGVNANVDLELYECMHWGVDIFSDMGTCAEK